MTDDPGQGKKRGRLRGVTELPATRGERRFRARISPGRGRQVNLGLYHTRWLAAFAYNVAAEALHGRGRAANEIPASEQPGRDEVVRISARVRRRLGLGGPDPVPADRPPGAEELLTVLEVTIVGFWRGQVAGHGADLGRELDMAARRLVDAARCVFWSHSSGHPTPPEALASVLGRRLDATFRRGDLTREVLDDEGDDEAQVARWLVYPDVLPGGGGFRDTIGRLYADLLGPADAASEPTSTGWASVLGIAPPFSVDQVRAAYRSRSKAVHPDLGGDHAEFVRLQSAYEQALRYCSSMGL